LKTYSVQTPDGKTFSRESTRPITFGIAHRSGDAWVVNSFSHGTEATAEKRLKSLQKFYRGDWALLEAIPTAND
jgi:hypothetical protein